MTAGEIGADYVCFGPVNDDGLTGAEVAPTDLFAWWGQMIEVPQVAEGNLTPQAIATLSPYVEFFALGGAIWTDPDGPLAGLEKLFPA
jgi:thiamine-phosphate pyrophosphorylase